MFSSIFNIKMATQKLSQFWYFFFFNFYCYSIRVVCLFSPSLHPTPEILVLFLMHAGMTAVKIQSNQIVFNEVKRN